MNNEIIATIECLYPVDSDYSDTSEIGKQLLIQAICECDWRTLPAAILQRYADKCMDQERLEYKRNVNINV